MTLDQITEQIKEIHRANGGNVAVAGDDHLAVFKYYGHLNTERIEIVRKQSGADYVDVTDDLIVFCWKGKP